MTATTISKDKIEDAMDRIEFNPAIDSEAVLHHMDAGIREAIHAEMHRTQICCSESGFLRVYIEAHFYKFNGEIFQIN